MATVHVTPIANWVWAPEPAERPFGKVLVATRVDAHRAMTVRPAGVIAPRDSTTGDSVT